MQKCSAQGVPPFKKVTHVIFDLDGLMLDTESINRKAISDIAGRFGKTYTPEMQGKVIGTVEKESSRIAITEMGLPMTVEEFQIEYRETVRKNLDNVPLMPGAALLVKHFHKHKIPIAVATSSSRESYELKAAKHQEIFSLFSHVVCGDGDPEVKEGKPKPYIFLICASRFSDKPQPEMCVVFEDAPNGVKAALAAGMQVVMVPDENLPMDLRKEATLVVKSLNDIPINLFGLPPLSC